VFFDYLKLKIKLTMSTQIATNDCGTGLERKREFNYFPSDYLGGVMQSLSAFVQTISQSDNGSGRPLATKVLEHLN